MKGTRNFEGRFVEIFRPIFIWGVGAFELGLILYTVYAEFTTGIGPSLISTVLPLSIAIAIAWAVFAVLITLAVLAIENRIKRNP